LRLSTADPIIYQVVRGLRVATRKFDHITSKVYLVDPEKREALAHKLVIVRLAKNERTFVKDTYANQLYLVLNGLLQIGGAESDTAGVAGPGDVFSFSDITFKGPRSFYLSRPLCLTDRHREFGAFLRVGF
jgi:CRP-like cAMP-binding protein